MEHKRENFRVFFETMSEIQKNNGGNIVLTDRQLSDLIDEMLSFKLHNRCARALYTAASIGIANDINVCCIYASMFELGMLYAQRRREEQSLEKMGLTE